MYFVCISYSYVHGPTVYVFSGVFIGTVLIPSQVILVDHYYALYHVILSSSVCSTILHYVGSFFGLKYLIS